MYETNISLNPLIPEKPLPLKKRAADLIQLSESTRSSLKRLKDAAKDDHAPRKGVKAAQKAENKYRDRLDELCTMDISALTENEISDLYIEVSAIITAIREANDLLH